jgi:hypothetical protein
MEVEASPDVAWVASLSGASIEAAARAVNEAADDRALFDHLVRAHRAEHRPSYGEIDAPLELGAIVRLTRPEHVVEVGVSSGVSSAYLLRALERNGTGTLHSIDRPSTPRRPRSGASFGSWSIPAGRRSGWAVPARLQRDWDLRIGDKAVVLPALAAELPGIDLFVYDVPHFDERIGPEFGAVDARLSAEGVAIVDHGPGGNLCPVLGRWARRRGSRAVRCGEWGLFGMRSRRPGKASVRRAPLRAAR